MRAQGAFVANAARTIREARKLWEQLIAVVKQKIQDYNEAIRAAPRYQLRVEVMPARIAIIGKSYKFVPYKGGYGKASCAVRLEVNFKEASKVVEYFTDPEMCKPGSLRIDVGETGCLSLFQSSGEISVDRAAGIILTEFLDWVDKPENNGEPSFGG